MARPSKPSKSGGNRILELLSVPVRNRILADCEKKDFGLREVLYEANKPMSSAYFPTDGIISVITTMDDGTEIEVATTGKEGMVGLPLFLGIDRTPLKAFSQVPGSTLAISASLFRKHVKREPELVDVLNRFAQALMMQISQSGACNRAHGVDQRCCRWLLMTHDRVDRDEFPLTQEFLAQMLGVRRATVSEVATQLQSDRLIRYSRGIINILNRRGLERRSCGCYWIIQTEYDRLVDHRGPKPS